MAPKKDSSVGDVAMRGLCDVGEHGGEIWLDDDSVFCESVVFVRVGRGMGWLCDVMLAVAVVGDGVVEVIVLDRWWKALFQSTRRFKRLQEKRCGSSTRPPAGFIRRNRLCSSFLVISVLLDHLLGAYGRPFKVTVTLYMLQPFWPIRRQASCAGGEHGRVPFESSPTLRLEASVWRATARCRANASERGPRPQYGYRSAVGRVPGQSR